MFVCMCMYMCPCVHLCVRQCVCVCFHLTDSRFQSRKSRVANTLRISRKKSAVNEFTAAIAECVRYRRDGISSQLFGASVWECGDRGGKGKLTQFPSCG